MELVHGLLVDPEKTLCCPLFRHLVLQVPHPVAVRKLLVRGAALGQHAALKAAHVEEKVGVVLAVDGDKAALPLDGGHRARKAVLNVPEYSATPATGKIKI